MKIIHTSDWHLGRQFHNVSLLEDQRHVLEQIVSSVKTENADALLISGDIYDRSVPPATAVELLDDVLNKVCNELSVPVLLVPGNHDSAERLRFGSRQLKQAGLHIFGDLKKVSEPVIIKGKSGIAVNFYGIPYNVPEQVRNLYDVQIGDYNEAHLFLLEQIKQSFNSNQINVLISHCFIDGSEESESERPLSIGGVDHISYDSLVDFNYVALGHLHRPQDRGKTHICYSGSILKYSFSEQLHKKGITLVEFDASGTPTIRPISLKPIRDLRVIEGKIADIVEQGKTDPNADDYIMVRLTDTHAILDAMGKLREVYPNILHLEKPGIMAIGEKKAMNREMLKRSEIDMFRDFYSQVSGTELTAEQNSALEEVVNGLHKAEADL